MGWCLSLQLHRARPLTSDELDQLCALLREIRTWDWEQAGLHLELPVGRRADGLVGQALVAVPMDADSDAQRVVDAAHRLHALLPDVAVWVDDDMGLVGTEDGLPALNGGDDPATLIDVGETEGAWQPALQELPETLPPKLLDAVALLGGPPPDAQDKKALRAHAQAKKAIASSTHVGKLALALEDDAVSKPQKATIRRLLADVDPVVVGTVALKRHKKLPYVARRLLEAANDALDDVTPLSEVWLAIWRKGKSRYHWGDLHNQIPDALLARMACHPEAHAQLVEDLEAAWEDWDEEAAVRRGGEAAETLGRSGTVAAAVALVAAVRRRADRSAPGELQRHTMRGVYAGLAQLVLGPHAAPERAPVASLLRAFTQVGRYDRDSPPLLLSALAVADPEGSWPLLLRLEESSTYALAAIAAARHSPHPEAGDLLRRLARSEQDDVRDKALDALVAREGPAALPFWLSLKVTRGDTERLVPPYTLQAHDIDRFRLPKTVEGLRGWLVERGLPAEVSVALPLEERAMPAGARRPSVGRKEHLLADLQAVYRTRDLRYAAVVAVGAAELGTKTWDSDPALDWADPEGMGLVELAELAPADRLDAVLAREDLPPQQLSAWLRALEAQGRLSAGVRHQITGYELFSKAERAAHEAAEAAWSAAHA